MCGEWTSYHRTQHYPKDEIHQLLCASLELVEEKQEKVRFER